MAADDVRGMAADVPALRACPSYSLDALGRLFRAKVILGRPCLGETSPRSPGRAEPVVFSPPEAQLTRGF